MSELLFASSNPKEIYRISSAVKQNKIRKIAPKIYSNNFEEQPSDIIRRNILEILGNLYPGSVLSHRSAFEFKPTDTAQIFVTYTYTKKIKLPGVTINFIKGAGPLIGDNKLLGELYVASKERALLENLQITKKIGPDSKTLGIPQIEEKLDDVLRVNGEDGLNQLRDKARKLSALLNMPREYEALTKITGALLRTKPSKTLQSGVARFRAAGLPYDRERITVLEILFKYLHNNEFQDRPENNGTQGSFRNFSFFEAYFSNYIEGTVFEVSEARQIVETGVPLPARSQDSHDILGTYQIVSDRNEMRMVSADSEEFGKLLQMRHQILMAARIDKQPGRFKTVNNRAGNTEFVDFRLVRGTLKRGLEYYNVLKNPFARAAYIMFLISEVHPFMDGNGRIARVMMNAELVNANQCKIIIPTVYREDYLLTLKNLTNNKAPAPYVEMLYKAQAFSANLHYENYDKLYDYLKTHNAFYEPSLGKNLII